jgi:IS30 family transposase
MTTACIVWWLLLPLAVVAAAICWLSESREQRIRRWHRAGRSQRSIAQALGISRYAVRQALT